jgi:hypothetical protein
MSYLRHAFVDIAALVLILVGALTRAEWAWWTIAVYTGLLVVLKIVGFLGRSLVRQTRTAADGPPALFYHALYAVSTIAMVVTGWWIIAAGWLTIWVLSYLTERYR